MVGLYSEVMAHKSGVRFTHGEPTGMSPVSKQVHDDLAQSARLSARAMQEMEMKTPVRSAKQHGATENASSSSGGTAWTPEMLAGMLGDLTMNVKEMRDTVMYLVKERNELVESVQSMWTAIHSTNSAVMTINDFLAKGNNVPGHAPSMAGSTGAYSKSDRADDGMFNSSTLCAFGVEYPAKVDSADKMCELLARKIGGAVGIPAVKIKASPIQDAFEKDVLGEGGNVVKKVTVQHFRLHFEDVETAFKVLRQKTAIHESVDVWVNEDLTPEQRALRKERVPVYKELRDRPGTWAQWRGAEIYYNNTFKLDYTRVNKSNGKPLLVRRGFWYRFTDYPVPVTENVEECVMTDRGDPNQKPGTGEAEVPYTADENGASSYAAATMSGGNAVGSGVSAANEGAVKTPNTNASGRGGAKPPKVSEQLRSGGGREGMQTGGTGGRGRE